MIAPKVYIKTFGCQMNEYDSDKMADVLRAAEGYEPTQDVEQVLNRIRSASSTLVVGS